MATPPDLDLRDTDFKVDITGGFTDAEGLEWMGFCGYAEDSLEDMKAKTEDVARRVWAQVLEARAEAIRVEAERVAAEEARRAEDARPWPRWERSPLQPEGTGWNLACFQSREQGGGCVAGIKVVVNAAKGQPAGVAWWNPPKKCSLQKVSSVREAIEALTARGIPEPPKNLTGDLNR